jgi:hypothetical protein
MKKYIYFFGDEMAAVMEDTGKVNTMGSPMVKCLAVNQRCREQLWTLGHIYVLSSLTDLHAGKAVKIKNIEDVDLVEYAVFIMEHST